MTPQAREHGRQMTQAALTLVQLEALRRRNYATARCPKWHEVLTRLQQAAMAKQDAAYVAMKAAQRGIA